MNETSHTEFDFELPHGYVDSLGTVHRSGTIRIAAESDISAPQQDSLAPSEPDVSHLSQFVTNLGSVTDVTPDVIGKLSEEDLAHLQEVYERARAGGDAEAAPGA
ncbi:hypothetical protein ABT126_45675 [Streptomyces sp. NPDC002012]|uniref:hypothetical protein n=1 Tax=Streptomyces sp. NPDC002012 TaxID=3154532 RepID=UPI003325E8E5